MAKILLVEDDNNLREIYEARLQAEGYTIVSAHDGEEALVVAKNEKPDLIISDIMMPKISGFEMLDILRNTDGLRDVKVIMLTALGQNDDQQRANKLGADRYLVKSQVTLEDIVKVAHELLSGESSNPAVPISTSTPQSDDQTNDQPADDAKPKVEAADSTPSTQIPSSSAPVEENNEESSLSAQPPVKPETTPAEAVEPPSEPAPQSLDNSEPESTTSSDSSPTATNTEPLTTEPAIDSQPAPVVSEDNNQQPPTVNQIADDKLMDDAVNNLVANPSPDSLAADNPQPAVAPLSDDDQTSTSTSSPESDIQLPLSSPTEPSVATPQSSALPITNPEQESDSLAEPLEREEKEVDSQIGGFASNTDPQNQETAKPTATPPSQPELTNETPAATNNEPSLPDNNQQATISSVAPAVQPPPTSDSQESNASVSVDRAVDQATPIAGKKVIEPLDTSTKPDINTLLAQEEAKSQNSGFNIPVNVTPSTPKTETGEDPNSIAL